MFYKLVGGQRPGRYTIHIMLYSPKDVGALVHSGVWTTLLWANMKSYMLPWQALISAVLGAKIPGIETMGDNETMDHEKVAKFCDKTQNLRCMGD
jgi:hypothetical protein